VGLGTGNKDQMLMHLQNILGIQAQAIQLQGGADGPLVTMQNIHQTVTKLVENAGLKNPEAFFTDPKNAQPQPPKPDPEMAKVEQQAEIDKAKLQLQAQNDQQKMALDVKKAQTETQLKLMEMNATLQLKQQESQVNQQMAREKAASDQTIAREKMAGDQDIKRTAAENKAEIHVGTDGKAAKISDTTGKLAEMLTAFIQRQAERDAKQDENFAKLAQALSADTQIVRDENGRAIGSKRVMQ
jgi:hypothetical protein